MHRKQKALKSIAYQIDSPCESQSDLDYSLIDSLFFLFHSKPLIFSSVISLLNDQAASEILPQCPILKSKYDDL